MLQAGEKYIHGTSPEKLKYDVYEENKVLKEKRKARMNARTKLEIVLVVFTCFIFGFMLIYRYALITEINYAIEKRHNEYDRLKDENARLKVDIEKETDLDNIRQIAETRLGMKKPDKYQVVNVSVPRIDVTEVADVYKNTNKYTADTVKQEKGSIVAVLLDRIEKIVNLLY